MIKVPSVTRGKGTAELLRLRGCFDVRFSVSNTCVYFISDVSNFLDNFQG